MQQKHDAVAFGKEQWNNYEGRWTDDFYSSLTKVVTMVASKRGVTLGSNVIFDTELIYSRAIGLLPSRNIDYRDIFKYELSPVQTLMFDDSGAMRITKTKSVLKQKLRVEQSARTSMQLQVVIIDGCAIL